MASGTGQSSQKTQLTLQNVCKALKFAYDNNNERTKKSAMNFFYAHSHLLLTTQDMMKSFIKLPKECILEMLITGKINLSQEEIYTAVIHWADRQCVVQHKDLTADNKRVVLGDILSKIRYTTMSTEFFNENVAAQRVLSVDDIIKVYQEFVANRFPSPTVQQIPVQPQDASIDEIIAYRESHDPGAGTIPIPDWLRCPEGKKILFRFKSTIAGKAYPKKCPDSITFSVSKDIILHGIYIYASHQTEHLFKIDLKILEKERAVKSIENESILTNGEAKACLLEFNPPVEIKAGRKYDIIMMVDIHGQTTYFGIDGQELLNDGSINFKFAINDHGLNGTSAEVGQFPALLYKVP